MTSRKTANRYYACHTGRDLPVPWDLTKEDGRSRGQVYLKRALRHMESRLEHGGLIFYITWKLDELPSYGKNVVAIVMGDEWCLYPEYTHDVLALFKCYGSQLPLGFSPFRRPSYLKLLVLLKYLRTTAHRFPWVARYYARRARRGIGANGAAAPMYDIPLGYGNLIDLPVKPIDERANGVFFAGSIEHWGNNEGSLRDRIGTPKVLARKEMLAALDALKRQHPDIEVQLATSDAFVLNALEWGVASKDVLDADEYSRRLMDSKICLVPRGTSVETFRFFEALRYGCIPVTEWLPSRWFYDGSPAIVVDRWEEIAEIVPALLKDPVRMQQKHEAALAWWQEKCSEEAVGAFMAERINRLGARRKA